MKLTRKTLLNCTKKVEFDYPRKLEKLGEELLLFMKSNGGVGLAANQVGLRDRVFVMHSFNFGDMVFFNPEIVEEFGGTVADKEGCLSFPGLQIPVWRSREVKLKWQDHKGEEHVRDFSGFESRCIQHEVDHLMGLTFHFRMMQ
ncbi:MAG: peptide deformylase [Candidatus Poseidoniales archaeon]